MTARRSRPRFASLLFVMAAIVGTGCATPGPAVPAPVERAAVPAGINDRFLDPDLDAEDWENRWEVEAREIYAQRHGIVAALELAPGESIGDVGTGTGLFLAPFSRAVGSTGTVYAIDISPRFIDHVAERVAREGLANVVPVLSRADSADLAPASVDVVFVCDTYHHFEHPPAMLASIRRALRRGGRLVVVDFERIPGVSREWIFGHVRAGKEVFTAEIEAAGFALIDEVEIEGLVENYLLRFRRR